MKIQWWLSIFLSYIGCADTGFEPGLADCGDRLCLRVEIQNLQLAKDTLKQHVKATWRLKASAPNIRRRFAVRQKLTLKRLASGHHLPLTRTEIIERKIEAVLYLCQSQVFLLDSLPSDYELVLEYLPAADSLMLEPATSHLARAKLTFSYP